MDVALRLLGSDEPVYDCWKAGGYWAYNYCCYPEMMHCLQVDPEWRSPEGYNMLAMWGHSLKLLALQLLHIFIF